MASQDPAATRSGVYQFTLESVVRGHHVYKRIWTPVVGQELQVAVEENNTHDSRAVAVRKGRTVVGHLPREVARSVFFFIKRGGTCKCEITGRRKKGNGLEVPCIYTFTGAHKLAVKLEGLLSSSSAGYPCSCPS